MISILHTIYNIYNKHIGKEKLMLKYGEYICKGVVKLVLKKLVFSSQYVCISVRSIY